MNTRTAIITIAGRPNVGKSTLTNYLVGEKIAIVSNKPQTTRNRICGIVTRDNLQFVFVDTPGYHKARTKLGDYMVNTVRESISDVDATILVVEPIPSVGSQEEALIEKLRNIHLCGYADNIEEKYLESSIFALTSRYEGYVLVLIEAQAKGLPCISFDCKEGPSEIIDDGVNGFLIEEGDIEEYSKKLMILMRDISLRKKFSESARKDLEKYDIRNILCEWEKIFYNLGVQKR